MVKNIFEIKSQIGKILKYYIGLRKRRISPKNFFKNHFKIDEYDLSIWGKNLILEGISFGFAYEIGIINFTIVLFIGKYYITFDTTKNNDEFVQKLFPWY